MRHFLTITLLSLMMTGVVIGSPVILNEYNAVKNTSYLNGYNDAYFGHVLGNGGNWFELVFTEDHVDMRNWTLEWKEASKAGTIYLSNASFWSDMRRGVILTIIENPASGGGRDTDRSVNFVDDWWLNISTVEEQAKYPSGDWLVRTVYTAGGGNAGDFTTSNDNWQLRIKNSAGVVVYGWCGEGIKPTSGVGSDEVFKLEESPTAAITPLSNYKDGSSSTFGAPNLWNSATMVQDFSTLRAGVPEPVTIVMLLFGGISLLGLERRNRV